MMSKLEIQNLKLIDAISRTGSLHRAADQLNLSASGVSRSLARLETRLGVSLFRRDSHHVEPTHACQKILDMSQRLLEDFQHLENQLFDHSGKVTGKIVLNAPVIFSQYYLVDLIAELAVEYPQLDIRINLDDRFINFADTNTDIAIRIGNIKDDRLYTRLLGQSRFGIYANPDFVTSHHETLKHPLHIKNEHCLEYRYPGTDKSFIWYLQENGERFSLAPGGRFVSNDGEFLANIAARGYGFLYIRDFMVTKQLAANTLVPVLEDFWPPVEPIHLVFAEPRYKDSRIAAVIDFLEGRLKTLLTSTH
ncbi:LysR family transcriptional regulator [Cobetia amphilecti]|uniref:LysR family transcriptional regulator n=1 Tax=Cobetia amphilecti TaxID=1055104 RepID=UPI0032989073